MCAEGRRSLRWIERGLLAIGIVCLGWSGVASLKAIRYQRVQQQTLERMRAAVPPAASAAPASVAPGDLIGSLEIPRLRVSAVIAQGDDDATLNVAIGHLT